MQIGQYITFNLDVWQGKKHLKQLTKAKIERFVHDPLKRHASKCLVHVNNTAYGIPFTEVVKVLPADNEQLKLNL